MNYELETDNTDNITFDPEYIIIFLREVILFLAKRGTNIVAKAVAVAVFSPMFRHEDAIRLCRSEMEILEATNEYVPVCTNDQKIIEIFYGAIKGILQAQQFSESDESFKSYSIKTTMDLIVELVSGQELNEITERAMNKYKAYTNLVGEIVDNA